MNGSNLAPKKASGKEVFAWALYDWANSAYSTLQITALMYFLTTIVFNPEGDAAQAVVDAAARWGFDAVETKTVGPSIYGFGLAASMFMAAILSPLLGAMADARASKRHWLGGTTLIGSLCALAMAVLPTEMAIVQTTLFVVMGLCFDLSFGFYNGFLPEIADEESMDRVSAWGFAFGYLGGALALILFLLVVNFGSTIGAADGVAQLRIGVAIIGLWWGLFTIPTILILRDRGVSRAAGQSTVQIARGAMVEVARTVRHIRRYRMLLIFLVGYLFINDGVQTVISQSSTFAVQELKFSALEATMLVLVFQFICLLGAMGVDPIIRRVGRKTTMIGYLLVWVVLLVAAVLVQTKTQLWILSVPLGLVIGGTQSVARSMMGLMTPPKRTAEFFGFFNFSGKATSWMGNFVFAAAIFTTGNFRLAIASLLVFFVIGCAFIYFVDVSRGQREALAEES